jgi:cytochrome c biogenesis protein CcmG/thiol:disulfide interchange protein DsbE
VLVTSDEPNAMDDSAQEPRSNEKIVRGWMRRALPWVLLAVAAWLAFGDLSTGTLVEDGVAAPALEAELSTGEAFALEAHRGEVVVLNFWATWCAPCRAEAPTLTRVHNHLSRRGGGVIGITADRAELSTVARHALGLGMEYPIGRTDQQAFERYRVSQLPTTYVVSPEGMITWSHVGAVSEERLRAAVDALF